MDRDSQKRALAEAHPVGTRVFRNRHANYLGTIVEWSPNHELFTVLWDAGVLGYSVEYPVTMTHDRVTLAGGGIKKLPILDVLAEI